MYIELILNFYFDDTSVQPKMLFSKEALYTWYLRDEGPATIFRDFSDDVSSKGWML